MDNNKKSKQEILDELNELQEKIVKKNELKKERMFFLQILSIYMNSKLSLFISFLIAIICSFILSYLEYSFSSLVLGLILFGITIFFNFIFALFKCGKNLEIKESFRNVSKRLAIELLLLFILILIFIIIRSGI